MPLGIEYKTLENSFCKRIPHTFRDLNWAKLVFINNNTSEFSNLKTKHSPYLLNIII